MQSLVEGKVKDAVLQGRGAWKGYRKAAIAGLAAQIQAIVPPEAKIVVIQSKTH